MPDPDAGGISKPRFLSEAGQLHDLRILIGVFRNEVGESPSTPSVAEIRASAHLLDAEIAQYGNRYFHGGKPASLERSICKLGVDFLVWRSIRNILSRSNRVDDAIAGDLEFPLNPSSDSSERKSDGSYVSGCRVSNGRGRGHVERDGELIYVLADEVLSLVDGLTRVIEWCLDACLAEDFGEGFIRIHELAVEDKGLERVIRLSGDGIFVNQLVSDRGYVATFVIAATDFAVVTVGGCREEDKINGVGTS